MALVYMHMCCSTTIPCSRNHLSLSRVVDEVTDVLSDHDCEVVTWEDVEKLEYTLQVWG